MSNNAAWHHRVPTPEDLQQALDELGADTATNNRGSAA
jgi:hypothetical protein